ncbi:MAG TPA: ferredoxin [Cytophagales bacterium]|jgi:NADP-reducing hydrogenase subunit HndD|nr:ferredoxin [Cytophagales bacterium]
MTMIRAKINNLPVEVEPGTSILKAAKLLNINIPVLCKHPDLKASAACGICVVRIANYNNKMLRACTTAVEEDMEIITHDPELTKLRRTILELILSFHPNDCLNCGRNGSCELQDLAASFSIRETRFDPNVEKKERDGSTEAIVMDAAKCIKCGRCIEVCQEIQDVWALTFLDRSYQVRMRPAGDLSLAESPCIKCGQCKIHCPTGAIYEYDDTKEVYKALLDEEKYCVVQIAPAVRVSIGEAFGLEPGKNLTKKVYAALRRLGFKGVFDTNFGADVTVMEEASEFAEILTNHPERLPLITTCCPSWVDFMEKRYHDLIPNFSSCKSPMQITGVLSKTYYPDTISVKPSKIFSVAVMPCTSKKTEVKRTEEMFASGKQDVDVVITTEELARMIRQAGIDFINLPDEEPDYVLGAYSGAGTIFGATGGVMEAALRSAYHFITKEHLTKVEFNDVRGIKGIKTAETTINGKTIRVAVAHGLGNVSRVLDEVRSAKEKGEETPYHFIEVMACPGGCIGGGGQPGKISNQIRMARIDALYEDDKEQRSLRTSYNNPYIKILYDKFLGKPLSKKSKELLHTKYIARPQYVK